MYYQMLFLLRVVVSNKKDDFREVPDKLSNYALKPKGEQDSISFLILKLHEGDGATSEKY